MRRAQMEMVGLVFVVLLVIIGIVLYAKFSSRTDGVARAAAEVQGSTSFLNALSETQVPECGTTISRVARACLEREGLCGDPCAELEQALETITAHTLTQQGYRYNLSLEHSQVQVVQDCQSASPDTLLASASAVQVVLTTPPHGRILLSICREP